MANWNPWHGCHKLSAGCKNCYVYRTDARYEKDSSVVTKTQNFRLPVMKKRDGSDKIPSGELVWTCFTSDFLVEDADEWRQDAWEIMRIRSDLSFLFITKRIDRLEQCLPDDWGIGYPNVHICCTVENQEMADEVYYPFEKQVMAKYAIIKANHQMIDTCDFLIAYVCQTGKARDFLAYAQRQSNRRNLHIENIAQ